MLTHTLKGIAVLMALLAGIGGIVIAFILSNSVEGWASLGLLAAVGIPSAIVAIMAAKYIFD